jgi:hypothetical protein
MATFEVVRRSGLSVDEAWTRLTDWQRHGHAMPLTKVSVTEPSEAVGTTFVARTGIGPVGFDDPMEVTHWQPPTESTIGVCRIVKHGRVAAAEHSSPFHRCQAAVRFAGRKKPGSGSAAVRWTPSTGGSAASSSAA